MHISFARYAIAVSLASVLAAGCSGSATPSLPFGAPQQAATTGSLPQPDAAMVALTTRDQIPAHVHAQTVRTWMSPDAKHTQYLLYVSDQPKGTVDVFAYRARPGNLLGQLAGFQFPYGECIDASANVYVVDFAAAKILEYAHGGDKPLKTLNDRYGYPIGCSVDPTTGNLAVANFEGLGHTCMGGIVVYKDASGKGKLYQDKDFNYYWPPGYDPHGNLFVEAKTKEKRGGKAGIAELAAGGAKLATVTLSGGTIKFPGGVQWDGHYVAATDQAFQGGHTSGIYRLTVSSSEAKIVGSTELPDECLKNNVPYSDIVQPWINGTVRPNHGLVAGNLSCTYRYGFWNYVKGGNPKRTLPYDLSPELAYGQTVSPKAR